MAGWKFGSQIYSPAKSVCQQQSIFTPEFTGEEEHPPLRDVLLGLHSEYEQTLYIEFCLVTMTK